MTTMEVVPWDGTDYGTGWERLAEAYFRIAGELDPLDAYLPQSDGVPTEFHDACQGKDGYFVAAIFAWLALCNTDLYPGISADEAPWVVEWASENYLGRYDSLTQFAEFELGNELPHSEWGIAWEDYVDFSMLASALEVMGVPGDSGHLYVFDNRYSGPDSYRRAWLGQQGTPMEVGEHVNVFIHSTDGYDAHAHPGVVRGKWQVGPGYEWMVAVELVGLTSGHEAGDVIVREDKQLYRPGAEGRPPQKPTQAQIAPLPTVRLAHKRVVEPEEEHHA